MVVCFANCGNACPKASFNVSVATGNASSDVTKASAAAVAAGSTKLAAIPSAPSTATATPASKRKSNNSYSTPPSHNPS